jgi:phosphate transport system permease protein
MAQTLSGDLAGATPGGHEPLRGSVSGRKARLTDWIFRNLTLLFAFSTVVLIAGIVFTLYMAARPNIAHSGGAFFHTSIWDSVAPDPDSGKKTGDLYGVLPFVYGTLVTSALALLLAVPLGVGAAIFLAEIAPRWLSTPLSFVIEMLAAVPSIVYGFWALLYLVPLLQNHVETWLGRNFGQIPLFASAPGTGSGNDFLAAGLILALMILPFITAVSRDVLRTVPQAQREAAYGIGATRWEAIKDIVLRYASGGIIGAIMLGLGRAIGETMAVTLVIGNAPTVPKLSDPASFSLFRPGNTMTSILANEYPSPNSPLHLSALTEVAFTLFFVTIVVNALARGLVWLTALRESGGDSEASIRAKAMVSGGIRFGLVGLFVVVILYQDYNDLRLHGAAGLFGGAEIIGLLALGLTLFNRQAPHLPIFPTWRRIGNLFATALCALCTLIAAGALAVLFFYVFKAGISSLNRQFFLKPNPLDPDKGGMLHAIVGTSEFILMASLLGIPLGILGGIFLAEFGKNRFGFWVRFATDLLNGVPSIVIGIFAYTLIIVNTHSNFGLAGGFALGVMMIPTVMRTTEELIRLVPMALREGSLALGATHARTIWQVVLPTARNGILTGVLLAVARVAGETAPLLMVGCNSNLWNTDPRGQLASLPMSIYVLRDAGTPLALSQSWGVALVLVTLVLVANLLARLATRSAAPAR